MTDFLALGLGELLWDMLPSARKLGGAPANFAFNINELGGKGMTVSRVGDDSLGRDALTLLQQYGLDTSAVTIDPVHPTGRVDVSIDVHGVAKYNFPDRVAWDFLEMSPALLDALPRVQAVCYGSLAQRNDVSCRTIHQALAQLPPKTLKLFDINLRLSFYTREIISQSLKSANVLKINDEELEILRRMFGLPSSDTEAMRTLCSKYSLHCAACTRGGNGSLLVTSDAQDDHAAPHPVQVVDTVGAGDSFSAVLAMGLHLGWELGRINGHANKVAAYVCTQNGAMNPLPEELKML